MTATEVVALITTHNSTLATVGLAVLGVVLTIAVVKKAGSLMGR
jgi:hypothetical protein